MTKDEFYKRVYEQQTLNRGLLTHDELLHHFEHARQKYYSTLLPYLPQDRNISVVDVGCGYGNFLYFLSQEGYQQYHGIDFDSNQVELAKKLGLNANTGDWKEVCETKQLGLITALDFLEHLSKEEMIPFLESCCKALNFDGKLVLRVPNAAGFFSATDYFNDLTHEWAFTPASIEALLGLCGFKDINCLNDRPRLSGIAGRAQQIVLRISRLLTKIWLASLGLPMPKTYTKSMWVIASKA